MRAEQSVMGNRKGVGRNARGVGAGAGVKIALNLGCVMRSWLFSELQFEYADRLFIELLITT